MEKLFRSNFPAINRNDTAIINLRVTMVTVVSSRRAILTAINELPQNITAMRINKYLKYLVFKKKIGLSVC